LSKKQTPGSTPDKVQYLVKQNPMVMKSLFYRLVLIALFFLFIFLTKMTAQISYNLDEFDAVSAAGDVTVILEPGDELRAEVDADGIPEDKISVRVDRGVLKIRLIDAFFYKNANVEVVVTYQKLREVRGHAGAYVRGTAPIEADKFEAKATSGARVELEVLADMLKASTSEGAQLRLSGEVRTQNAAAITGGQYYGLDLECERTYVRAGTGGEAEVVANEMLDAAANTGGTIEYRGNPEEKETRVIIAGSVRKI
jgi:hypothetical protein